MVLETWVFKLLSLQQINGVWCFSELVHCVENLIKLSFTEEMHSQAGMNQIVLYGQWKLAI